MEFSNALTNLVIDDDKGHSELVRRNPLRGGVANPIVCLVGGNEAVDYIACRGRFAEIGSGAELLVLLEINMPGVNGIEVLRQIKSDPHKKTIPVIMLTTNDDPPQVKHCYELGCNVYATKPVDPEAFVETVRRMGMFTSIVRVSELS